MTEREHYGYYDIFYTDAEDRTKEICVEQMSLTTRIKAERCARSWQAMTWTEGRKYSCRLTPAIVELQT